MCEHGGSHDESGSQLGEDTLPGGPPGRVRPTRPSSIIHVEGYQLYTSKYLLANVSPKFRQMFTDSAAGNPNILPLSGVKHHAVVYLLCWLLPTQSLILSDQSVELLLPLVCHYDIDKLLKECDQYLMDKLKISGQPESYVKYLLLADRYMLADTLEYTVDQLSRLTTDELKRIKRCDDIKSNTMYQIMHKRIQLLESRTRASEKEALPETITLVVEDCEIEASVAALTTASDVFKAMITSDFLESETGRIAMPGKTCDAVEFMVHFVTSTEHVPIPGEKLISCIELAEEYMLGRLKHACAEYMVSSATAANLNDCMLYLSLAVRYQLPSVENKVVDLISDVDTRQMLSCSNFDRTSVASLMLKRAQILETSVNTYKGNMSSVNSLVQNMFKRVRNQMGNELQWRLSRE